MLPLKTLLAALTVVATALVPLPTATAATARIGPGVQMITAGGQCTANFVFKDGRGRVYVGYAAHCASTGGSTSTNGCTTGSLPLGTRVRFTTGAGLLSNGTTLGYGRLRYSSWLAMQRYGASANACQHNDFALVRVDPAYVSRVNPTVPRLGGPTALGGLPAVGAKVFTLGSSSLLGGTPRARQASVTDRTSTHATVRSLVPGVPGDSGSGYLDSRGRAVGVLSTIGLFPNTLANGIGGLAWEVAYARNHGFSTLRLVPGRAPFSP